jgi:hypothetical protein
MEYFESPWYRIMSSAIKGNFTSPFPIHTPFISIMLKYDCIPGIFRIFIFIFLFFKLSYSAGLLVTNFLNLHLSENIFILSSFLKDIFARYRILGWFFFVLILSAF